MANRFYCWLIRKRKKELIANRTRPYLMENGHRTQVRKDATKTRLMDTNQNCTPQRTVKRLQTTIGLKNFRSFFFFCVPPFFPFSFFRFGPMFYSGGFLLFFHTFLSLMTRKDRQYNKCHEITIPTHDVR
jgi:hypothetical protein